MTDAAAGKPKNLSNGEKAITFGIDTTEAAVTANRAKGLNTPGWVKYATYTDAQGNTRHKSEVLVAAGSMGGDTGGGDDSVVPDSDIVLIAANTLTVNNGIQAFYDPNLFFWDLTKANEFKAASPSTFYYVEFDGVQTKVEGATFGNVVASGPYHGIQVLTGTKTVGNWLSGAANSRIYY